VTEVWGRLAPMTVWVRLCFVVAYVGGNWSNGSNAGLFSLGSDCSSFYYYPYIGSRLLVLPES
jgi:hypothetical protein